MLHYMQFHSTSLPPHLLLTFPLPSTLSPKAYGINTSDKLPSQLSFTVASERMQIVIQCLTPPLFLSLSHPAFISLQLVMDVFIVWLSESFTSSYCFSQRHGEKSLTHGQTCTQHITIRLPDLPVSPQQPKRSSAGRTAMTVKKKRQMKLLSECLLLC